MGYFKYLLTESHVDIATSVLRWIALVFGFLLVVGLSKHYPLILLIVFLAGVGLVVRRSYINYKIERDL